MTITVNTTYVREHLHEIADKLAITELVELDLEDGSSLQITATTEPDDLSWGDLEDPAVFGRLEHVHAAPHRPLDFSGDSVKLHVHFPYVTWYEYPPHLRSRRAGGFPDDKSWREARAAHLMYVKDVYLYGYLVVSVELTHNTPEGYSKSWRESIGGIEPFPADEIMIELYRDLLHGVLSTIDA